MAYAIVKHDLACTGMVSDHRSEFLIDAEEDLANIVEKVAPGSIAKMADGSAEYVMSPSKEWTKQVVAEPSIPVFAAEDAGKVLGINEDGELAWIELPAPEESPEQSV